MSAPDRRPRAASTAPRSDSASPEACIVCGRSTWSPSLDVLLRCDGCGFLRADCRADDAAIAELYGERYFQGEEYADYLAERAVHRKNFERRYEAMLRCVDRLDSVYEIGCAYGLWLEFLSARGVRCAGVDICSQAAAFARETLHQNAAAGDFLEQAIEPGAYQAFVLWDTIEHLLHPERFVARIAALLPPGGWLFLTTGDIGSRNARRRGARWRMIHPPTHLQYFSRATLGRFLTRHGLEERAVESAPVYRNLRGTLAALQILGQSRLLQRLARLTATLVPTAAQERLGLWTDLGDIMFVAARKP